MIELTKGIIVKKRKKVIVLVCAGLLILITFAAFFNGLVVRRYTVKTDKLNSGESFRLVLIADLHSHIYGDDQSELVSLIRKQEPDAILLVGDIADDKKPLTGVRLLLEGIREISPVYYVTGNHEFWLYSIEQTKDEFREYGVRVLENEYDHLKVDDINIVFAGVEDPDIRLFKEFSYDWAGEMEDAFLPLRSESGFKVLLAHRPELIDEYKKFDFDLVVSGHSHGGQIRIPLFVNGFYAPDQGWFPRYAGGRYKHGALTHIVSRGTSNPLFIPRVFNPPELAVIDVVGGT